MADNSMYTGDEEVRDYEYEDEIEKKIKRRRNIGIGILIALLLLFVFLFVKACFTDTDIVEVSENEKTLLKAGKEYFEVNYEERPTEKGECKKVTLNTLLLAGMIEKKNYINCKGNNTYVQVCKLENKKEQWTPVLACDEIATYFDEWQKGDEDNLIADQSDVKFKYLGQKVDTSDSSVGLVEEYWKDNIPYSAYKKLGETTYYRSRAKLYIWNLNKKTYYPGTGYYVSSPGKGYTYKDTATTAYKWYKTTSTTKKVYYNRNWVEQSKPRTTSTYVVHICKKTVDAKNSYYSPNKACDETEYPIEVGTYNACTSVTKTDENKCYKCDSGKLNNSNTSCGYYTEWKQISSSCAVGDLCKVGTTSVTTKTYYPSGSSTASGQKTYYPSSPAAGYTNKDSKATAYKWYKLTKTGTSSVATNLAPAKNATRTGTYTYGAWSKWTSTKIAGSNTKQVQTKKKIKLQQYTNISNKDWKDITDGYVTEKTLIKAFNDNKFNVKTLKDINSNGKIRYKLKMYYRNRIEGGE